jgi:hypothetical protein
MSHSKLIEGNFIDNEAKKWHILHNGSDYYGVSIDGFLINDNVAFYIEKSYESYITGQVRFFEDFQRFEADADFLTLIYSNNNKKLLKRKKIKP